MPIALNKRLGLMETEFIDLLTDMYKSMSQAQIAKQIGCEVTAIEKWFRRGNIPRRSHSEKIGLRFRRSVDISPLHMEMLNGLLLSDFHLEPTVFQTRISFGFKYLEFAKTIINELQEFQWSDPKQDRHTNCWHSKSKSFIDLVNWRNKWYFQRKKNCTK